MHHYFEAITNTSGDSLIGYFGRVVDPATNNAVTISADDNGTPIVTTSGVENAAKTDDYGNLDFYVAPGTYHLDIYAPNATSLILRVQNVAMNSTKGDTGDPGAQGDVGASDASFTTLAALKDIDPSAFPSPRLAAPSGADGGVDNGLFSYQLGNYTGRTDVVQVNGIPLSTGALVRPTLGSTLYQASSAAIIRRGDDRLRDELVFVTDYGAVPDGTTNNAAAFAAAVDRGVALNRPVYIPPAAGAYATGSRFRPYTGLYGHGINSKIAPLVGFSDPAVIDMGWLPSENSSPAQALPFYGINIVGKGARPATRSSNPADIGVNYAGVRFMAMANGITGERIKITGCFRGFENDNNFGHLGFRDSVFNNNWYNGYWSSNTGDYVLDRCDLAAPLFASMGASGNNQGDGIHLGGIFGLFTKDTHMGFGPYVYYQPDGTSTIGLSGCHFDHRHEYVGNSVYRVGTATSGSRVISDVWFSKPGHSWTLPGNADYAQYTIVGDGNYPVQEIALDLPLVGTLPSGISEGDSFLVGTSGFATRIANATTKWADCNSRYEYVVSGIGNENVVYSGPVYRATNVTGNKQFGADAGGVSNFPVFNVPKKWDGATYGYISFNGRVVNNAPGGGSVNGVQVRVLVNGSQSGVIAAIDLPSNASGNIALILPPIRFPLGRRNRTNDTHTVALQFISPSGGAQDIYFNPAFDGQVTLTIDQGMAA